MNSIAQATGKSVTTITDMAKKAEEEKGSIGNRLEYGVKQAFLLKQTAAKDALVTTAGLAATGAAAGAVANSETAQNAIINTTKKVLNNSTVKKALTEVKDTVGPYASKIGKRIGAYIAFNPKGAAAIAGVIAAGTLITNMVSRHIRGKGIYEAGKLDQQYTDKAKLEKVLG